MDTLNTDQAMGQMPEKIAINKSSDKRLKVAIIGAGSSGIAACKNFKDNQIDFDCFEAGDRVGGNWVFKNKNKMSSAYRSLHINTSRQKMEYKDFPMPKSYPDFPGHELVAKYFQDYADHFGLADDITFNTKVIDAEKLEDHSWRLELDSGEIRFYDALVVANGHHWSPRLPEHAKDGSFSGQELHAHHYIDHQEPFNLKNKKIVVIGMGNSAMDIACELSHGSLGNKVYLSGRSGVFIIPKYLGGGKPLDYLVRHPGDKPKWYEHILPNSWLEWMAYKYLHLKVKSLVGLPQDSGLPKPKSTMGKTHPTASSEIHYRLGAGDITPKPDIEKKLGSKIQFTDGSIEEVDAIIYATGYDIKFPFFKNKQMNLLGKNNDIPLFYRMVDSKHANLLFLGLVQPLCSIIPLAELQAKWMSKYLKGDYHLPSANNMDTQAKAFDESNKKRYEISARHTIQTNCLEYSRLLRKETNKGIRRAQKMQCEPQLPAIAWQKKNQQRIQGGQTPATTRLNNQLSSDQFDQV